MEKEFFISGYCRAYDQSRTVCAEFEDGKLNGTDCSYPDCPYTDSCTIAGQIRETEKKEAENV